MPDIAHLSTTQKNDVFRAITRLGLNSADFRWKVVDVRSAEVIENPLDSNIGRGHWFLFTLGVDEATFQSLPTMYRRGYQWNGGAHCIAFEPGEETPSGKLYQLPWDRVLLSLRDWLERVKAETELTDLWAVLSREGQSLQVLPPDVENSPFEPDEARQLAAALDRFVEEVRASRLETKEQLNDLTRRVRGIEARE
jgi:hypothetical protein